MKAFVLAAALAALSSSAVAEAARDVHKRPIGVDSPAATVIADAGRLGSASLTSLNGNSHWTPGNRQTEADFDMLTAQVDLGTLAVALCIVAFAVSRPISRALRRQEQQRRATALASTLGHTPNA